MYPIDLVLDGPYCLILVEQTHLIGLRLIHQQVGLLQVIDRILGQRALRIHHIELQIGILTQDQQLKVIIEVLTQIPLRTALSEHSDLGLEPANLEALHIGWQEGKVEDSQLELAVLGGEVGDLGVDGALVLTGIVHDVAADGMGGAGVVEEGVHVVPAVPNHLVLVLQFQDEAVRVLGHFDQEDLVDRFVRDRRSSAAFCDLSEGDVAGEFALGLGGVEGFNEDVEVALEDWRRGVALHGSNYNY